MKVPTKPPQPDLINVYQQFNEHCRGVLHLIEILGQQQILPRTESRYYGALLQEMRASISQSAMEALDQREISAGARASRERLALESEC